MLKKIYKLAVILLAAMVCTGTPLSVFAVENYTTESSDGIAGEQSDPDASYIQEEMEETVSETAAGDDSEELFAGYVNQLFYGAPTPGKIMLKARRVTQGSKLTGANAKAYQILEEKICAVAEGKLSSTIVTMSLADLGLKKIEFTAADLGESSLVYEMNGNRYVIEKAYERAGFNIKKVMNALIADHPYEMYWFDKTIGYSHNTWTRMINKNTGEVVSIYLSDPFRISMPVAAAYAADTTAEKCYQTDAVQCGRATAAAENAKAIVAENAERPDAEKLINYKQEICNRVSYNRNVTYGSSDAAYGDPWQMVYVFDNDTSTNVVCEGYSKAFQYLCDQSDFDNEIVCNSMTGNMKGPSTSGNHMWNVVRINGNNYMADVTNSDTGTIGSSGQLFLKGSVTNADENGYTIPLTGTRSMVYQYDDDTIASYTAEERILSKTAFSTEDAEHSFDAGVIVQNVDCENPERTMYTCQDEDCAYIKTVDTKEPLGHDYDYENRTYTWADDYSSATASAVCKHDSSHVLHETTDQIQTKVLTQETCESAGSVLYTAAFANKSFYSTEIEVEIPPTGHNYGEPEYTWSGDNQSVTAVTICKNDETHVITETAETTCEITEAPACDKSEVHTFTAAFSNELFTVQTKKVELDPVGHIYTAEPDWSWKWTAEGYVAAAVFTCDVCGQTETVNASVEKEEQPDGITMYRASVVFDDKTYQSQDYAVTAAQEEIDRVMDEISRAVADSSEETIRLEDEEKVSAVRQAYSAWDSLAPEQQAAAFEDPARRKQVEDLTAIYQKIAVLEETAKKAQEEARLQQAEKEQIAAEAASEDEAGHITADALDNLLTAMKKNVDSAGSRYETLMARLSSAKKKSLKIKWNRVSGASGYLVYANKSSANKRYKKVADLSGGSVRSFTLKKINGSKLKQNTYYKIVIAAYKTTSYGEKRIISVSKAVYAATAGGKNGNIKKLTGSKAKITLKKGKKIRLKIKQIPVNGKQVRQFRVLSYESSAPAIAKVTKKGVIKAKKKGTCNIDIYAQDGTSKTVRVRVK